MGVVSLDAPAAWNLLKGFVCIYKPPMVTSSKVKKIFLGNLVNDLNELQVRPPKPFVKIEGDTRQPMKVSVIENYADNPLVVGPRYQVEDFKCKWASFLDRKTSGVAVLALNRHAFDTDHWQNCIKTYHIRGKLGLVTDNMFIDGRMLYDNVKYDFIRRDHMDKILSAFQANHQKRMFQLAGVDISSQAAYELAIKGPIRPVNLDEPVVYGLQCLHFKSPDFLIEIQCIGEYEEFLIRLIYDLGQKLRSAAVCTAVQCIRHAQFTLEHSLLHKHWRVNHVIEQIAHNEQLIKGIEIKPQLQNLFDVDTKI